jgi:hypothetical protein
MAGVTTKSDGWVSSAELRERLAAEGYAIDDRRLERWREAGLLTAVAQSGNYKGSTTWHPPETTGQAIAVSRALKQKNKFDFAGSAMWAAGFDVDERYWKRGLSKADAIFRTGAPLIRHVVRLAERRWEHATLGDVVARLAGPAAPFAKISRRLSREETATVTNLAVEIASGEFEDFPAPDYAGLAQHGLAHQSAADLLHRAFDLDKGADDAVAGNRLKLRDALEGALRSISEAQLTSRIADFSPTELSDARDDVRNAMKIGICLHESVRWVYGDTAFGLRFISQFMRTLPVNLIFANTLGIARLRRLQAPLLSSGEIATLANQAEKTWLISNYFRELHFSRPDLSHLIGPDRMKLSFSSGIEYQKMLKELEGYQFPEPQFRPWDSWRKLAKSTMSPGLLAMSIGAPERLTLAEVAAGANGTAIR